MSQVDSLLAQLQAEAETRGPEWLQEYLGPMLNAPAASTSAGVRESGRARLSRPTECFSPEPSPRTQHHIGSPHSWAPSGPPAKRATMPPKGVPEGIPSMDRAQRAGGRSVSPGAATVPVWQRESD